jgi:hypothetical protein
MWGLYGDMLCFLKRYQGLLTCVNARSGATLFGPECPPGIRDVYASPMGAAGRIYIVDRSGIRSRENDNPWTACVTSSGRFPTLCRTQLSRTAGRMGK